MYYAKQMRQIEKVVRSANIDLDGVQYLDEHEVLLVCLDDGEVIPLKVKQREIKHYTHKIWWGVEVWLASSQSSEYDKVWCCFSTSILDGDFYTIKSVAREVKRQDGWRNVVGMQYRYFDTYGRIKLILLLEAVFESSRNVNRFIRSHIRRKKKRRRKLKLENHMSKLIAKTVVSFIDILETLGASEGFTPVSLGESVPLAWIIDDWKKPAIKREFTWI